MKKNKRVRNTRRRESTRSMVRRFGKIDGIDMDRERLSTLEGLVVGAVGRFVGFKLGMCVGDGVG